jgi:hypothetical protein
MPMWLTVVFMFFGVCGGLCLCTVIGQQVGFLPDGTEYAQTAVVQAQLTEPAQTDAIKPAETETKDVENQPSETSSPAVTTTASAIPSPTITNSPSPFPTITNTVQGRAPNTPEANDILQSRISEIEGVEEILLVSVMEQRGTGLPMVYLELIVADGQSNETMAQTLLQETTAILGARYADFSMILDDCDTPISFTFDFEDDVWRSNPVGTNSAC